MTGGGKSEALLSGIFCILSRLSPRAEMKQPSGHVLLIADPQEQEQNKLREHVECLWSVTFTDVQLVKAKQWAKLISKGV